MGTDKKDTSTPYTEYKDQPSQKKKKKYIQLSLPIRLANMKARNQNGPNEV